MSDLPTFHSHSDTTVCLFGVCSVTLVDGCEFENLNLILDMGLCQPQIIKLWKYSSSALNLIFLTFGVAYRVLAASGPHWEALEMLSTCIDASSLSLLTKIGLWFLGLWVYVKNISA